MDNPYQGSGFGPMMEKPGDEYTELKFICPICHKIGIPSVYGDCCTACSNNYQDWSREASRNASLPDKSAHQKMSEWYSQTNWLTQADIDRPDPKPGLYTSWWEACKRIGFILAVAVLTFAAGYIGRQAFKLIIGR